MLIFETLREELIKSKKHLVNVGKDITQGDLEALLDPSSSETTDPKNNPFYSTKDLDQQYALTPVTYKHDSFVVPIKSILTFKLLSDRRSQYQKKN